MTSAAAMICAASAMVENVTLTSHTGGITMTGKPTSFDNSPVRLLTTQQIDDIFSGKITNWSQVGAHDAPIMVYRRRDCDAITNVMRNDIFSNQSAVPRWGCGGC